MTFSGYNKPRRGEAGSSKKFAVLAKKGDKVKLVRFGDPEHEHQERSAGTQGQLLRALRRHQRN